MRWTIPILAAISLALASCGPDANDASEQATATNDGQAVASVALRGGICSAPLKKCGGKCVDLQTDPNNCGTCGQVCPKPGFGPAACNSGICQCLWPLTLCNGECVDLQRDPNNCGTCGHVCMTGIYGQFACNSGSCQCLRLGCLKSDPGTRCCLAHPDCGPC